MHIINSVTIISYHFSTFEFKFSLISWQTIFFNVAHRIICTKDMHLLKNISRPNFFRRVKAMLPR